jgi:hypothetical protein
LQAQEQSMTVVISLNQPLIDDGPKQVGRLRKNALKPKAREEDAIDD